MSLIITMLVALSIFFGRMLNYFSADIVDVISQNQATPEVLKNLVFLIVLVFVSIAVQSFLEVLQRIFELKFIPYYLSKVSHDLFNRAHKHSSTFFAEEMAGNVAGKIKNIISKTETAYYHVLHGLLRPVMNLAICVLLIGTASWSLGIWFLGVSFIFMIVMIKLKKKIIPISERKAKAESEATGVMVDSITNSDLVKNFSNFLHEKHLYYTSVNKSMKAMKNEIRQMALIDYGTKSIFDAMTISFYFLVLYYWYTADLTVAGVVLALSLISSMVNSVQSISYFATEFARILGNIGDGLKLLSKPLDIVDAPDAKPLKIKKAEIEISHLDYHYKLSHPLFKDFNLKIKSGEKIGLVGRSGSGKSTLVRLLSRYYDIQGGTIKIDGQDIAKVTQNSLRRHIAMIPQDPSLFHRTIMENIRYGNTRASDEEVMEAAKKAYCHDFIMEMPQGYQSKVGERGVMLSGGERQRIAIARAILKNSSILILDEATSALDSESEKYIQESLKLLMKDKTVIAIAHRLSTLKEMDRVVVMNKGEIVEEGTHTVLTRKKGLYYSFYNMQTSGFLQIDGKKDD